MMVVTAIPRTYVCRFCGKEFSRDEAKPVFGRDDSNPLQAELVFCSRGCAVQYDHARNKDW